MKTRQVRGCSEGMQGERREAKRGNPQGIRLCQGIVCKKTLLGEDPGMGKECDLRIPVGERTGGEAVE